MRHLKRTAISVSEAYSFSGAFATAPANKKAPHQQGSMLAKLGSSNDLKRLQTRQLLNRKLMGLGGQFCQMLLCCFQRLAFFDNLLPL